MPQRFSLLRESGAGIVETIKEIDCPNSKKERNVRERAFDGAEPEKLNSSGPRDCHQRGIQTEMRRQEEGSFEEAGIRLDVARGNTHLHPQYRIPVHFRECGEVYVCWHFRGRDR